MIYLIEDDESIRKLVMYALETQGFSSEGFDSAEQFWKAMDKEIPELVILDIMLPGEDGLSVLKKIRRKHELLPVIMLTAKSSEYDRVTGLDMGADDYISKPFGIMELIARIKAVLRRTNQGTVEAAADHEYGNLKMIGNRREVYVDDEQVVLTYKEYELLNLFMENKGLVLTREFLLNRVWGLDADRENRTLDVHVRSLRAKLKTAGDYIQTVRGVGYKFAAER